MWYLENKKPVDGNYEKVARENLKDYTGGARVIYPTTMNDRFVRLNSGLGSNTGLDSPFSAPGTILNFDKRYVVIDKHGVADHSGIYKQGGVRNVILNWLAKEVLSEYKITVKNLKPIRNDVR